MDRTGKKTSDMRHVSFRMPAEVHRDYVDVAQSRGVDLSAVLNWVLTEMQPVLLLRRAEHGAAMLRAVGVNMPQGTGAGSNPQETLARVEQVICQLQDVASKLAMQMGIAQRRTAA